MPDGAVFLTFTLDVAAEDLPAVAPPFGAAPLPFGAFEMAPGTQAPWSLNDACRVADDAEDAPVPAGEPHGPPPPWDGTLAPGTQAPRWPR